MAPVRRILGIAPVLAVIAALSLTAAGAGATGGSGTLGANQRAARADAAALLNAVTLPPEARRLSAEPAGDHGYLNVAGPLTGSPAAYSDHRWWQVPDVTPAQVIAAVRATPPRGTIAMDPDSAGNLRTGTSAQGEMFHLAPVHGQIIDRLVAVTATALTDHRTGVVIQSNSVYEVPRPAGARIPSATHAVRLQALTSTGRVLVTRTLTAPPRVHAVVTFLDSLELTQPGAINCPAEPIRVDVIDLVFLARADSRPLAVARYPETLRGPSLNACNPVTLTLTGQRRGYPLLGGRYLGALDRLFSLRLPD